MTDARVLGGRYEIGPLLGHGGMAEVHLGRDLRLGRDVAVKLLRADLARDPVFLSRFQREAHSSAQLNHPSIVAVYDTGEDHVGDTVLPYIVMEYVDGRTLRDIVHDEGPLPPARALAIVSEVCDALDYSHRAGIVHRDIKPGNVMLTHTGQVKVMDFGIARAVAAATATMTQTAAVMGTAQYLSPEQARGETVDARSDVYSTGCLLYELVTGQPPFTGDSPVAVAYQHVREAPIAPSELVPPLPASVDAIVLHALAKEPANRYQSAEAMRADIERARAGRPVTAQPTYDAPTERIAPAVAMTSVIPPVQEREKRSRRALGWVALWLLVLAVFVGAFFAGKALIGTKTAKVAVPKVTGLTLARAESTLSAKHLQAKVGSYRTVSSGAANVVLGQDPGAGSQLAANGVVTLVVSQHAQQVAVPDVAGKNITQATQILKDSHLQLGGTKTVDTAKPTGVVVGTDPAKGTKVDKNAPITLVVATGNVPVPDVKGKPVSEAEAALRKSSFTVNEVPRESSTADPGTVVDENPAGGQKAPYQSTVTIYYATQPSPSASPSTTPSSTPSTTPSTTTPSAPASSKGSPSPSG